MKFTLYSFLIITIFAFSACDRNNDNEVRTEEDRIRESQLRDRDGEIRHCFEFVYPITYIMSDGTEITGNNAEEVGTAIRTWQMANPNLDLEPALQFPVDLLYVDGTIVTVNDDLELTNAYRDCFGETERDECFDILFPLNFELPDGTTVTGNRDELGTAIDAWYADNPNSDQRPVLLFPFDIQYEDGTVVTINNETELRDAYGDCDDGE